MKYAIFAKSNSSLVLSDSCFLGGEYSYPVFVQGAKETEFNNNFGEEIAAKSTTPEECSSIFIDSSEGNCRPSTESSGGCHGECVPFHASVCSKEAGIHIGGGSGSPPTVPPTISPTHQTNIPTTVLVTPSVVPAVNTPRTFAPHTHPTMSASPSSLATPTVRPTLDTPIIGQGSNPSTPHGERPTVPHTRPTTSASPSSLAPVRNMRTFSPAGMAANSPTHSSNNLPSSALTAKPTISLAPSRTAVAMLSGLAFNMGSMVARSAGEFHQTDFIVVDGQVVFADDEPGRSRGLAGTMKGRTQRSLRGAF